MPRLFLWTAVLTLLFSTAHAETHLVKMLTRSDKGVMLYEPDHLVIAPGDEVRFLATQSGHNAATIKEMLPAGAEAFIGKIDEEITVQFTQPGVYGIKCSPHYAMGMVMLIEVGEVEATPENLPAGLPRRAKERFVEILTRAR